MSKKAKVMEMESTERQKRYVQEQESKGGGLGVVFADAFLRGMRDIGYKNPAWALSEMVDNAVQAAASTVAVRFGFMAENSSKAKPDMIALIDDGVGMIPKMIGYAVRWGGTDREDDRTGFGRYGYGLPSSAVSIAKRYTVYSKIKGGAWHAVTVDIDELSRVAGDPEATNKMLEPRKAAPPVWAVKKSSQLDLSAGESGTVVLLEDLDRLRKLNGWITMRSLKQRLMQHFGVIYRHWLPQPGILVDEEPIEPVDPLFLMENGRFYAETSVMARPVGTRAFEVETSRGTQGRIKIRASYLPPNFQKADPKAPLRTGKVNKRHDIMKAYNGLIICREGRQIDCIQPRWTKFQNYDYNTKIEIDYEPELDEFFGITTAKQQIVFDDEMWDRLEGIGKLRDLVKDIRGLFHEERDTILGQQQNAESPDEPRPSEQAMMESEKFKSRPDHPTEEEKSQAREHLERKAKEISDSTKRPEDEVIQELEERTEARRFEREFQDIPEGPFYRATRLGEQKRLIINTLHPFYSKVYAVAPPESQAALEVLLFVLAEAELESKGDFRSFYVAARGNWSDRLRHALDALAPDDAMRDKAAAVAEKMQMGAAEVAPDETFEEVAV